jgi:diguanylate cyclase (GGDEF)-like protein/PAS domain S-box-containing protein
MITDVNPFLIKMLGYTREEFVEKRIWEVGAFKDIEASQEAFKALQKNEYIRYEDLPLRAKNGKLIDVEFVSNVYLVGNEKVIQCNIRDITERKQAQDALLKSQALLREQSVRDHLTGLFNRRYMEETLERELLRASRIGLSLGIMMMDVDHFKRFNDTWGHAAGDAVLIGFARRVAGLVRSSDTLGRIGGEEFAIVAPETNREQAATLAEHIRAGVMDLVIEFGQERIARTLSCGVAELQGEDDNLEALMAAADKALYQAKSEGGNRACIALRPAGASTR